MKNMPNRKQMTPKAICQLMLVASHTNQMLLRAKSAPHRCVQVLPSSAFLGQKDLLSVGFVTMNHAFSTYGWNVLRK